jgi:Ca2+-binding RTX toxin-like protein
MATYVFNGITYNSQVATADNQTIFGNTQNSWIQVLGGLNTVFGGSGDNVVMVGLKPLAIFFDSYFYKSDVVGSTGVGADGYSTPPGRTTTYLGSGNDYVNSDTGQDTVYFGDGNNIFDGQSGGPADKAGNVIYAGSGNDVMTAGTGSTVYAGEGNNRITAFGFRETDRLTTIYTGAGNDQIQASNNGINGANLIYAGEGNNKIRAYSLKDNTIYCGAGNDLIVAQGNNTIYAGEGNNTIDLYGTSTVYAGSGKDIFSLRSSGTALLAYTDGTDANLTTIIGYGANDVIDTSFLGRVVFTDIDITYIPATITLTQSQGDVLLGADGSTVARIKYTQVGNVRLTNTPTGFSDDNYSPFSDVLRQFD